MEYVYLAENHLVIKTEDIAGVTGLEFFTLIQDMIEDFRENNFIERESTRIIFSRRVFNQVDRAAFKHYGKYNATEIYGIIFKVEESPEYPIQITNDI